MSSNNSERFRSAVHTVIEQQPISQVKPGANTKIAKMKKLNIFSAANRKNNMNRQNSVPFTPPAGDTINRIVNKKEEEKLKWQKEQEEFNRRRREHEIQLVEIEQQEVERREEEVRRRNDDLDEKRRKHRLIQDAVAEQVKILNLKLEEYRIDHRKEEEDLEDDIAGMEDRLAEVKKDLDMRMRELEITFEKSDPPSRAPSSASTIPGKGDLTFSLPSAPQPTADDGASSTLMSVSYPKLSISDGMLTLDNSTKMLHQQNASAISDRNNAIIRPAPRQFGVGQGATSNGSSPLTSHSDSSRSLTPKTDHADADNCV